MISVSKRCVFALAICLLPVAAYCQEDLYPQSTDPGQQDLSRPQGSQYPLPSQPYPQTSEPRGNSGNLNRDPQQRQTYDPSNPGSDPRNQSELNRNRVPLRPLPPTDFQKLVKGATGQMLQIYGASLFENVPSTFAPVDRIPVTPDYVIGPGDELLIRVWGQVQLDGRFTVDRSGQISIPQVGTFRVSGLPFAQITSYLHDQIARTYRNFEINVNVGQLRSIQIFVVGQARRPGSYTVSSLSTLVNALFASGGPAQSGSFRRIQVKRGTGIATEFDFYDFLLKGDKSKDIALLPGDVIYIPPVGPQVAASGSVGSPAIYELNGSTPTLDDLLQLAGGLNPVASTSQARVERISDHSFREVMDVRLDAAGLKSTLQGGDIVEVKAIVDRFSNAVTLRGNVANPGRYQWSPGMHLHDLIPSKESLLTREYWSRRAQLGLPALEYAPEMTVQGTMGRRSSSSDYASSPRSSTQTGVNPSSTPENGDTPRNNDETRQLDPSLAAGPTDGNNTDRTGEAPRLAAAQQAISANGGSAATVAVATSSGSASFPARNGVVLTAPEIDFAYAVVERVNKIDLTTSLLPFHLGKLLIDGDRNEDLELQPGDIVTIFSKADIRVPLVQQTKYVRLEGEFLSSGVYSVQPGETLRQLVMRAGGLSPNAYLYGSQFTRESTRVLQQQRLNEYADTLERRVAEVASNIAHDALNLQDSTLTAANLTEARGTVAKIRQLRASGRIVLDLKADAVQVAQLPDLPLEDGDRFLVPSLPSTIDVYGAVYDQNSFLYDPQRRVGDYLRAAGGETRSADRKRIYVIRADGSVVSRQYSSHLFSSGFDATRLNPGDAVVVPDDVNKRAFLRVLTDVSSVIGQFGLGAAAINVLR